ncbi:hypothetical protein LTR56_012262 [Elasticomyces elasticus]|nr:hypothetical protein LTR22_021027 [Elasticomyces elasticus]KAK3639687.1 hypothetical protein LTR56_012262 [Elasticomyces elasticus]KAK4922549.1 hypothetical protein LTR49_010074 [Elasticomyces elasticus]KAK5760722.1 hypothetical protein LTS12_009078 [Elasticomyces elasticus]
MEDDEDIYAECIDFCWHSYDYPSTNTKASAIVATNAGLGPRTALAAANPPWTPTSAVVPATHTPSPKESCIASCGPKDWICFERCLEARSPYPGPDTAARECKAVCQHFTVGPSYPGAFQDCLQICASSYDEVSTGNAQFTVTIPNSDLVPRATLTTPATTPQLAQRTLIPVSIVPDSPDIEVSPKEKCLTECSPQDIACKARCVGVPHPNAAQIAATNKCEAACPQGSGTAAQTQSYAACLQKCVDSFYFSGTGTIAAGITATATTTSEGMGLGSTTAGPGPSAVSRQIFKFASSSSTSSGSVTLRTHSATGSTASSSPTGGPASSGSAPKLGQAGGLFGLMMAMLAL